MLKFNRCSATTKLPSRRCLPRRSLHETPLRQNQALSWLASTSWNKENNIQNNSGISSSQSLPLILHLISHLTTSDQSQAQQGILSPQNLPSPFLCQQIRQIGERDSGNLINPFKRINDQMTRHLATIIESQLLPPLTCAWLTSFNLTSGAGGRHHMVSTLSPVIAMLGVIERLWVILHSS